MDSEEQKNIFALGQISLDFSLNPFQLLYYIQL